MVFIKNKKGQSDVESNLGWFALFVLIIFLMSSITSEDYCNKVLLSLACLFGIIWLFTGSSLPHSLEIGQLRFTLPLSVILLILWAILKIIGICTPLTELITQILNIT